MISHIKFRIQTRGAQASRRLYSRNRCGCCTNSIALMPDYSLYPCRRDASVPGRRINPPGISDGQKRCKCGGWHSSLLGSPNPYAPRGSGSPVKRQRTPSVKSETGFCTNQESALPVTSPKSKSVMPARSHSRFHSSGEMAPDLNCSTATKG